MEREERYKGGEIWEGEGGGKERGERQRGKEIGGWGWGGGGGGRENKREGIEREAGERGKESDPTNCRSSYSANCMRKNKEIG